MTLSLQGIATWSPMYEGTGIKMCVCGGGECDLAKMVREGLPKDMAIKFYFQHE